MVNLELEVEYLQNRVSTLEQEVALMRAIFGQINMATNIGGQAETKDPYPAKTASVIFNTLIRGEAITTDQYDSIVSFSNTENVSNSGDFCRELIVSFKKLVTKHAGSDDIVTDMKYETILAHLKEISKFCNSEARKKEKNIDKKKDLLKAEKFAVRQYCVNIKAAAGPSGAAGAP